MIKRDPQPSQTGSQPIENEMQFCYSRNLILQFYMKKTKL